MKTSMSLFTAILLFAAVNLSFANETIKGNKNIVTKTVSVSDYDEISLAGQMDVIYEQSDAAPYFEITIDENVFPYVLIEVKGSTLKVGPQRDGNSSYNIQPTVYKIKTNSKELKKLDKAGSGDFKVVSPLKTNKLTINSAGSGSVEFQQDVICDQTEINMAGSGDVELRNQIKATDLKLSMAGSGSIVANGVSAEKANCSLSSSGKIKIDGTAREITYSVAGSGQIKAYNCKANQVKSSISGSGKIELYAIDELNASVMGSGQISYKGDPSVQSSKMGSGSVKRVN